MATKNTPSKNFKRKYGQNSPIPNQQVYLNAYKDAAFFELGLAVTRFQAMKRISKLFQ